MIKFILIIIPQPVFISCVVFLLIQECILFGKYLCCYFKSLLLKLYSHLDQNFFKNLMSIVPNFLGLRTFLITHIFLHELSGSFQLNKNIFILLLVWHQLNLFSKLFCFLWMLHLLFIHFLGDCFNCSNQNINIFSQSFTQYSFIIEFLGSVQCWCFLIS